MTKTDFLRWVSSAVPFDVPLCVTGDDGQLNFSPKVHSSLWAACVMGDAGLSSFNTQPVAVLC